MRLQRAGRVAKTSGTDLLSVSFCSMAEKIGDVYVRYLKLMPNVRKWIDDTAVSESQG